MTAGLVLGLALLLWLALSIVPFTPFKVRPQALFASAVTLFAVIIVAPLAATGSPNLAGSADGFAASSAPASAQLADLDEMRAAARLHSRAQFWQRPPVGKMGARMLWVTAPDVDRHTCPSEACGVVGRYYKRSRLWVHERRDPWVRVSQYYDAACEDKQSPYVNRGEASCTPTNGIADGRLAEWVHTKDLGLSEPELPHGQSPVEQAIVESDHFIRYRDVFLQAAERLQADGRCSLLDLETWGGWVESANATHREEPIYQVRCSASGRDIAIFLNAQSGELTERELRPARG